MNCLYQDSHGYLWIGTRDGASRFDGLSFKNYSTQEGLSNNNVRAIIEDKQTPGVLWFAMADGYLNRVNENQITKIKPEYRDSTDHITNMVRSSMGVIYASTERGELFIIHQTSVVSLPLQKHFTNITQIALLHDTLLYIGSFEGLFAYSFRLNTLSPITIPSISSFPSLRVFALCIDSIGSLWAVMSGKIILKIEGTSIISWKDVQAMGDLFLVDDNHGYLWSGAYSGLYKFSKDRFPADDIIHYTEENGLPDTRLRTACKDRENNLWIGNNGVSKLANLSFITYSLTGSLKPVLSLFSSSVDELGHLWVAADTGLLEFLFNNHTISKPVVHPVHDVINRNEFRLPRILTIDRSNCLWTSTVRYGIESFAIEYKGKQGSTIRMLQKTIAGIPSDNKFIKWIDVENKTRIWVGVYRTGIYLLDPTRHTPLLKTFTQEEGIPSTDIVAYCHDKSGNLWLLSKDDGACILPANELRQGNYRFRMIQHSSEGKRNTCIMEDNEGQIWIGTERGIAHCSTGNDPEWNFDLSLPESPVTCMFQDRAHRLWIGTDNGIYYLENTQSRTPHWISQTIGMPIYAMGENLYGMSWFSSEATIGIFSLDYETFSPPPIFLTHLYNNDRDIALNKNLQFDHTQNNCRFHFIGIAFHDELPMLYRYRLLPINQRWSEPTTEAIVHYLSLQPGTYQFEVKAIDNNAVESATPAAISLTILRPYWEEWWFISSVILTVLGVAYGIYRYRIAKIIEVNQIKMQIASDLHDELAGNISSIAMLSEIINDENTLHVDSTGRTEILSRISNLARESVDFIRDILWTIESKAETLEHILIRYRDITVPLCQAKGIRVEFHIPTSDALPKGMLTSLHQKHLWLLLKEVLNNVLKHSNASTLIINAAVETKTVSITIRDNGKGFQTDTPMSGKGLSTMKMRAAQIGAAFFIVSEPGVGTEVRISLPI